MKKRLAIVLASIDGVNFPDLTEITPITQGGPPGLTRMADIQISGLFDDAGACPAVGGNLGDSHELVIKVGRKQFSVPVVMVKSEVMKKRRRHARWQVTMMPMEPGVWTQPKKTTKKRAR